ncbi:hypothetical protein [Aeoliella mucimassa]|uniref:Uncharacterized protein n=1 Tax=Aeoliella mucimassa TaxID=2527972 RepID=A0A518ALA4_9BACT|nr:hypothetical protein [Aeoliella mucimassa]QDU55476.1 hypothetical protein Pan181_16650 [Aeoliella mucimassa]
MPEPTGITAEISRSRWEDTETLAQLFHDGLQNMGHFEPVGEQQLPSSYATLLAHEDHMTVTLEAYFETLVTLTVVRQTIEHDFYARQSLLARQSDGAVVQYGIVRLVTAGLPWEVRDAIQTHRGPLGRVLIRNNLLRHVELRALWRIEPTDELRVPLALEPDDVIYGRLAVIHLDGRRAVEVLEIVTDHPRPIPEVYPVP